MAQRTQTFSALVLGANGKLGRLLCAAWAGGAGPGLSILPVSRCGAYGLTWSPSVWGHVLPEADVVVALWGVTPARGGVLSQNTDLALKAMEVAVQVGANRVLHCSSAAVYDTQSLISRETDACAPTSDYGRAKLAMEQALTDWSAAHPGGPKPVSLRIGNVAGAESLFAAIASKDTVTLDQFMDGRGPARSYIAPGDLARVIAALALAPLERLHDVYNVAAPGLTPMEEIAQAAGCRVAWRTAPADAVQTVALDTARQQAVCALPSTSFDAAWLVQDWRNWSGAR